MSNDKIFMAGLLLAAAALLQHGPAAAEPQAMVVVRDAATGQLRAATGAEVRALRAQDTRLGLAAPRPAPVQVRANGTLHKHLGGAAMVYAVTVRGADGKLGMQCVKGEQAAEAALTHPIPAARPTEEHSHETD